ncbi:MAG: Mur ligase family protein, partial [Candidatus Daviesbacteria bacterium]|nr:Mur ligase family protein [Candidatus Daviesbacteria bacterium]
RVLKAAGKKVSMVSTINAVVGGESLDTGFHVTSPDSFLVQKLVKKSADFGDEYLVLEVTSHAIDQYRFWGINFDIGVITNITHEHLDYHKTFENYFRTKLKLIEKAKFALVNQVVRGFGGVEGKLFTFGLTKGDFNQKELKLKLKVPGSYNIENALAALGVAFVLDIDRKIAVKELEGFEGITGRMEEIKNNKGIKIFVDFAHTPNALEQALVTLKGEASGKLIAVFGSAGKRDEGKRSLMGGVAGRLADFTIITAEDPRGELEVINKQILKGAEKAGGVLGKNVFVVEDRKEAINLAINEIAKKEDTVGIFGKGHERSMNLDGKKEIPWSDREAVEGVLESGSLVHKAPFDQLV